MCIDELTNRERAVIKLISNGSTDKEIASLFGISFYTVKKHRSNIIEKLGALNSCHAVKIANENGIL